MTVRHLLAGALAAMVIAGAAGCARSSGAPSSGSGAPSSGSAASSSGSSGSGSPARQPSANEPSGATPAAGAPTQTAVGPVPGPPQDLRPRTNPYAGNVAAMVDGRALYVRMNCIGCHGGRAGGGMGPSLRDEDWLYGDSDAQIYSSIIEGRAHGMPSWGPLLTEEQVWKLVAYVKSLRTPDEPHPPS